MSDFSINPNLVARGYDTNKDGKVSDNLKIKQDKKIIDALGGDTNVSVSELENAIKNDSVIIKNGEIFAKESAKKTPELAQDIIKVNSTASNALSQTQSLLPAKAPKEPNWTDRGDDVRVDEYYKRDLKSYNEDVKKDREILVNALNVIITTSKDPHIKTIASGALMNTRIDNINSFEVNKDNHKLITDDHNNLRQTLKEIQSITNFKQPSQTINNANKKINQAYESVKAEEAKVITAMNSANNEINAINNSWFPLFKEWRMESEVAKLNEIKKINPVAEVDKLSELARKSYELSVNVSDNITPSEAKNIENSANNISTAASQIDIKAKDNIKKLNQ